MVRVEMQLTEILVSMARYPKVAEAIWFLRQFQFSSTTRFEKYMKVFKAYECLCSRPLITYSAIRHAISHSESTLNRPRTLHTLTQIFGGPKIDLAKARHRKLFWSHLASLLVLVDSLLYDAILKNLTQFRKPNQLKIY